MKPDPLGNTELPDLPLESIAPPSEDALELPDDFRLVGDELEVIDDAPAVVSAGNEHVAREYFLTFRDAVKQNDSERAMRNLRTAIQLDRRSFELVPSAKYRIDEIAESDRTCIVFRCTNLDSNESVLVRTFSELNPEQGERFFELEKKLQKLNNPQIVLPADFGTLGVSGKRRAYLVAGTSDWPTLEGDIFDEGALTAKQLIALANVLVDTLLAAHDHGLFHGELNPKQIHVRKEGKKWQIQIVGLGLAPLLGRQTNDSDYVAPELRANRSRTDIDATAEVYSFGKVCSFAMFGNPNPTPAEWEEIPKPLIDFLLDCTKPDPKERLQNFDQVYRELVRKGETLSASTAKKPKPLSKPGSSSPSSKQTPSPLPTSPQNSPNPPSGRGKKSSAEKRQEAFERAFDQTPLVIFGAILTAVMCVGGLAFLFF